MGSSDLTGQARWWTAHWSRRAVEGVVAALSPEARHVALRSIEGHDDSLEVDFRWPSRFRDGCLVSSHVVAPAATLTIPADDVIPVEVGRHWGELRVHRVRRAVIDPRTGLVFHRGRVLTASGHGWRSARDGALLSGAGGRAHHTLPGAFVRGPVSPAGEVHNYGHFLLEAVPRLLRVREVEPRVQALIPGTVPQYARDILELLGIAWKPMPDGAPIRSDDVWLCDPTPTGWSHPSDMDVLRSRVLAQLGPGVGTAPRLFVSRRGLPRAPHNAHLIEEQLADWGFAVVRPQELGFVDQVRVFAGARVVVADFGAGMSNTVFMAAGGQIVDVMSGEWWTPHFRQMSAMLGHTYRMVPLPATDERPFGDGQDAVRLLDPLVDR